MAVGTRILAELRKYSKFKALLTMASSLFGAAGCALPLAVHPAVQLS
jgi:hypothetical protein